jgi:LacI family transcriptional regulator, galactose operon repressor
MTTIYDVAKAANVSPKTVSRVLNGDAPVKSETRDAVERAIARLGFVPSSAARMMRSSRSRLVGLVTGAISASPSGTEPVGLPDIFIVQGVQGALADAGITLLISDTGGKTERTPDLLRTLHEHRVEGIVYVAGHHQELTLPAAFDGSRVVLVNCYDAAGTPCVLPDDKGGQYSLVKGLIERGHRRIGFLTLPEALVAQRLRLEGYRQALSDAGISFDPSLVRVVDAEGTPREAQIIGSAIDSFRAMREPPTVVCCGNDRLAVGVYGILRSKGIGVPDVMSVAGYDDYRVISETLFPPLTTVELPYRAMGELAGELLLSVLRGTPASELPRATRVPGAVFWRASVTDKPNERKLIKSKRRK